MKIWNKRGPSIEIRGTPISKSKTELHESFIFVLYILSEGWVFITFKTSYEKLNPSDFAIKKSYTIKSKPLFGLVIKVPHQGPLSRFRSIFQS